MSDGFGPPTRRALGSSHWMTAEDFEQQARARLNPTLFDFVSGGAGEELTMAANVAAFRSWRLRPRVPASVAPVRLDTAVLDTNLGLPLFVAPMGQQWSLHPEGEAGSAAGAAAAGAGFVLSASSPRAMAAVAEAAGPARWYQLYMRSDRALDAELIAAAEDLGYQAICVTVDTPVLGLRRRDVRHGFQGGRGAPLGDEPPPRSSAGPELYPDVVAFAPTTWEDLDWVRGRTKLPVVVKGILDPADAELAIERGLAGIVVSNHGGRQLDQAPASLDVLPSVVEAAAGRVPVLLDGGVRRGADIAIALCLGARAVGVGRPVLWALATDGPAGVERLLRSLAAELARTLLLLGVTSAGDLGRHFVERAAR